VPAVRARATATAPDSSARVSRAARPPAHGARAPHRPRLRRARPGGWAATRGVRGRSWGGAGCGGGRRRGDARPWQAAARTAGAGSAPTPLPPRSAPPGRRVRRGSRGPRRPAWGGDGESSWRSFSVLAPLLDARGGTILSGHYTRSSVSAGPSLYRRHRPRTFADVVGQEHVVRTLRNAVEQDKVHHAYLFVGSRGTGKTSMAKILAACLNCEHGPTVEPCGKCDSCVAIASATSLDVIEMDAASNNSVDDIRDLRESVAYAPVSGRSKVYILDEAHMLSPQAWNAFLKTLEEPPPHPIFVLATTEAQNVLPVLGVADADLLFGAVDAVAAGDAAAALRAAAGLADTGRDLTMFARDLEAHARELLVVQVLGELPAELRVTRDRDERLAEQARRIG